MSAKRVVDTTLDPSTPATITVVAHPTVDRYCRIVLAAAGNGQAHQALTADMLRDLAAACEQSADDLDAKIRASRDSGGAT